MTNAWPLRGYAPGGYMGRPCLGCGKQLENVDKRASECLECAVIGVKDDLQRAKDMTKTVSEIAAAPLRRQMVLAAVEALPRPCLVSQIQELMGFDVAETIADLTQDDQALQFVYPLRVAGVDAGPQFVDFRWVKADG